MSDELSINAILTDLRAYAKRSGDPALQERVRQLEAALLGTNSSITVGDIKDSTAVAIGKNIRLVVNQNTNLPDDLLARLVALADALNQRAGARLDDRHAPLQLESYHWVDLFKPGGYRGMIRSLQLRAQESQFAPVEIMEAPEEGIAEETSLLRSREMVSLLNRFTDGWSTFRSLHVLGWVWAWLLAAWAVTPSLRWPFVNREQAFLAIVMYIAGALTVPLVVGLLTNTSNSKFWRERPLADDRTIRLYTHQGAGIGFHLGYFPVFVVNLAIYYAGYYFGVSSNLLLQRLLEVVEVTFILIIAYGCARLTPDNLWRAYKRLSLADGAIFFVFLGMGPFWGAFFYYYYPVILDPVIGLIFLLFTFSLAVGAMAWQQKRTGTTIIPAHWYTIFFGSLLALYLLTVNENLFGVVAFEGTILTLGILLAFGRIRATFWGGVGFLLVSGLWYIVLSFNLWLGRILVGVTLLAWWRWGRKYLALPLSFWGMISTMAGCLLMMQQKWLTDPQSSIIFGAITLLLLLWEYREHKLQGKIPADLSK